jgi:hypothetical protein
MGGKVGDDEAEGRVVEGEGDGDAALVADHIRNSRRNGARLRLKYYNSKN